MALFGFKLDECIEDPLAERTAVDDVEWMLAFRGFKPCTEGLGFDFTPLIPLTEEFFAGAVVDGGFPGAIFFSPAVPAVDVDTEAEAAFVGTGIVL